MHRVLYVAAGIGSNASIDEGFGAGRSLKKSEMRGKQIQAFVLFLEKHEKLYP